MSVWKKVTSKVLEENVKENVLIAALNSMDMGLDKTKKAIRNSWGADTCYGAIVNSEGRTTDVGIVFTDKGGLEITGDLWCSGLGIQDGGHQELLDKISQAYQVEHIKMNASQLLWNITSTKVNDQGFVEIEMEQF